MAVDARADLMKERGATRTDREVGEDALRRWLAGQDGALEEWLSGRVHPIARRPRTLATA